MSAMRTLVVITLALAASACAKTIITSPTASAADTATLIKEFSSQVLPGGSASREFEITAAGSIGVTLKTTTPAGVAMGLGVGIPRTNGSCALSSAVETVAGATAQITIPADVGTYCAKVYDLGTLSVPVPFTLSISRP
jgi:hypothetical protein